MLPLRHRRRWLVASAVLLLLTLAAALMPAFWFFDSKLDALRWLKNSDKWLHGLGFLVLALWFSGLYAVRSFWRVAIGLLAFGSLIELLQRAIGYRTADPIDIVADATGIMLGLAIGVLVTAEWCLRFERRWANNEIDSE